MIRASLAAATILKLNDDELVTVRPLFDLPDNETDACRELCRTFDLELVCVTKGEHGCLVHGAAGTAEVPGTNVTVGRHGGLRRCLLGGTAGEALER